MRHTPMTRVPVLVALLLVLSGCGAEPPAGHGSSSADDAPLMAWATVLEGQGHGPQLCVGGVADSLPPQCGGPDLVGWDWSAVDGEESVHGTTWGEYVVIGTYDAAGDTFTPDRTAVPMDEYDGPRPSAPPQDDQFATPCPEPDGGWQVVDPATTTEGSMNEVNRAANHLNGFARLWVDMNDPELTIVNVAVTGDTADAERALRKIWGGPLCVSNLEHTDRELRGIQRELSRRDDMLSVGTGRDHVELGVVWDDGSLQSRMDEQYGKGLVLVQSALAPYPG